MDAKPLLLILVPLLVLRCGGAVAAERPQEVSVPVHVRAEWIKLAPELPEAAAPLPVTAMSAVRFLRAVDPKTGKDYDESNEALNCDPAGLRRAFRMDQKEFLLGEPILVEFRVALVGQGECSEPLGGNNRARGRDDNFLFLMRHEDGTWVADPYAPVKMALGGLGSGFTVQPGKPLSYWLAVQRWCAVERPGTYDLFCFQWAHGLDIRGRRAAMADALPAELRKDHTLDADGLLVDAATGQRSERYSLATLVVHIGEDGAREWGRTPLLGDLPAEPLEQVPKLWDAGQTTDFAHFRIVIREGTDAERGAMVTRWDDVVSVSDDQKPWLGRARAAREAIQFAQQDDFLSLIEWWTTSDRSRDVSNFTGLAMRPSREATELLLKCEPRDVLYGAGRLRQDKIADLIPHLIEWLADGDTEVRWQAEFWLCKWTGQAFQHTWEETDRQRPTLDEGKAMQPAWRAWWDENKAGFTPVQH